MLVTTFLMIRKMVTMKPLTLLKNGHTRNNNYAANSAELLM